MQSRIYDLERAAREPVAVIGIGCRYPGGANDPESFWRVLRDGIDAVCEIPRSRWRIEDYYNPDPDAPGAMTTRHGGFLEDVDRFDAAFFRISAREAAGMDPQQRILLEVAWEALENAGVAVPGPSSAAVFVGISNNDYLKLQLTRCGPESIDSYHASGSLMNVAAGRLAYVFGFQGPAMAVDSACSSSLTAVHLACRSLRGRECDMALACGVNLILSPELNINLSKARMMARDGRCKTFDAKADGYVRGEGCGVVVLQRLSDAIRDGNRVLAVIRGSAINNDGPGSGLTVPNGFAQQDVIRRALNDGGIDPSAISYVEAHGTGTPLGDPIEVRALAEALSPGRDETRPFAIGSVKTNFGHTEAAAGLAGLIKVILALQHEVLPAHLHFEKPNPEIGLDRMNAFVPVSNVPWPRAVRPRIAGISSFGFSGTNAHVVLEEAPALDPDEKDSSRPVHILALSARTNTALSRLIASYSQFLDSNLSEPLADICYTANTGRVHLPFRFAAVAATHQELREKFDRASHEQRSACVECKPVFLFTGQGSQYACMAQRLRDHFPVFRSSMDHCQELLRDELPRPLLEAISDDALIHQTIYTQPALFALEYSLADLWKSWGIEPRAVIGHSLGEYVATCVAGVFTLEEALRLVAARARLMQALPENHGAMAAVSASEARVAQAIAPFRDRVSIGAVNGPGNVVVSGDKDAVHSVCGTLAAEGVACRPLTVSHAFHSPLMIPMLEDYEEVLRSVAFRPPSIAFVSNLTGDFMHEEPDAQYWLRQIREPVRFADGISRLYAQQYRTWLEVGPQPTLTGMARQFVADDECRWLPSLRRGADDLATIFQSLSQLYTAGASIDWTGIDAGCGRRKISLPTYPFERERYWLEPRAIPTRRAEHPILGSRIPTAAEEIIFENQFSAATPPLLDDHRIHGTMVVPASCYTSMALSAALRCLGPGPFVATDLVFPRALILRDDEIRKVQLILKPNGDSSASFRLSSACQDEWTLHAAGTIANAARQNQTLAEPFETIASRCPARVRGEDFYSEYRGIGYDLGPRFQWMDTIWRRDSEAVCLMKNPLAPTEAVLDSLHPGLIDSCLQLLCHGLPKGGVTGFVENGEVYIPLSIGHLEYHRPASTGMWCHARVEDAETNDNQIFKGRFALFDNSGRLVASATDVRLIRARRETLFRSERPTSNDWLNQLVWIPQPADSHATPAPGTWVILVDRGGVAMELAALMEGRACLRNAEELSSQDHVIDLRCLDRDASAVENSTRLLRLIQRGCRSLWVVTRNARLDPDQAAVWGLGRVASAEHPEFWRGLIDLDFDTVAGESARLIFTEIGFSVGEDQVGFSRGVREVARMAPVSLRSRPDRLSLKASATYLITGAFGALGIDAAELLASRGAVTLVLLGRSAPAAEVRRRIQALENQGVRIVQAIVDVSDRSALSGFFDKMRHETPVLRGVIHAAGTLDDASLHEQTSERFARVFAPKADGAWNLHELTISEDLDFFVLFSSFASLMGLPGEGSYAAANAYLDALAHYRRTIGLPALAINWGPWADAGMAVRNGYRGADLIAPADGSRILEDLLASTETQVTVMPGLFTTWRKQHPRGETAPLLGAFKPAAAPVPDFDLAAVFAQSASERDRLVEEAVASAISRTLSISAAKLAFDVPLSEYGLDSLSAFSAINRIKSEMKVSLPIQKLLGGASIRQIAQQIVQELLVNSLTSAAPPVEADWETVEI
jgi:acyl transferase domain-containing protein/acyl carrier protein